MTRKLEIVHFNETGDRRVTTPVARAGGVPLARREAVWQPSRHPAERSVTTLWWAATTGRLVGCRSLDRLTMAMVLDFNPAVVELQAWSAQLRWQEKGRARTLVPDFFVRTAQGATVVVSCPPTAGPSQRWARQVEVLKEACAEAGWQMGTPRLPTAMALANLRWVARYRHPRCHDPAVARSLRAVFAQPRPLAEGVRATGLPKLSTLPRLYHLLWRRELGIDWSRALGPASVVSAVRGQEPLALRRPLEVEQA